MATTRQADHMKSSAKAVAASAAAFEAPTVNERLDQARHLSVLVDMAISGSDGLELDEFHRESIVSALRVVAEHIWHVQDNLPDAVLRQPAPTPDQRDAARGLGGEQ